MSTQDQARLQKKLRELIGDDRITITGGNGASFTDDSGQEVRAENLDGSNRHFNQVRDRVFKPPIEDDVPETPDVAVLIGCKREDNNRVDYWVTYLRPDRRNLWAYAGWTPLSLDISEYWGYENDYEGAEGRFEFWPYQGATGGGLGAVASESILTGASIYAGEGSVEFQGVMFEGDFDEGGVVTPQWEKTLTDYSVDGFVAISTLCQPLGEDYSDISWDWQGTAGFSTTSDPEDRFRKRVGEWEKGGGETEVNPVKNWTVTTSEGSVFLRQETEPEIFSSEDNFESGTLRWNDGAEYYTGEYLSYAVTEVTPSERYTQELQTRAIQFLTEVYGRCQSQSGGIVGTTVSGLSTSPRTTYVCPTGDNRTTYQFNYVNMQGDTVELGGWHLAWRFLYEISLVTTETGGSFTYFSKRWRYGDGFNELISVTEYSPESTGNIDPGEYKLEVFSKGRKVLEKTYEFDPRPELEVNESGSYYLAVYDERGIEVASFISDEKITSSVCYNQSGKIKEVFQNKTGPGDFSDTATYSEADTCSGDPVGPPSIESDISTVREGMKSQVYVNGTLLAEAKMEGYSQGQRPLLPENPATGDRPCNIQRESEDFADRRFPASSGFQAFFYMKADSKDKDGNPHVWEPFDFGSVSGGFAPSPTINYTFGLLSSYLSIDYTPKAFISYAPYYKEEREEGGVEDDDDTGYRVYPMVKGFVYGVYGRLYSTEGTLSPTQKIPGNLDDYVSDWEKLIKINNRTRLGIMPPSNYDKGGPFEKVDALDETQRALEPFSRYKGDPMSEDLKKRKFGFYATERDQAEDWRSAAVTFSDSPHGGSTAVEKSNWQNPFFSVSVKGNDRRFLLLDKQEIESLLDATESKSIRIEELDEEGEPLASHTFRASPIGRTDEGTVFPDYYKSKEVLAAAAIFF